MVIAQQNSVTPKEYADSTPYKTEKKFKDPENDEESPKIKTNALDVKVYKRRWLQITLFVFYSTLNNLQCYQYTVVSNVMSRYYNISDFTVSWTSTIIMFIYVVLIFPASYLLSRFGLRWIVLVGGTGTCLGAWIKYYSSSPDRFLGVFIGQALIGVSQVVVLTIPSKIAACWFGSNQVATATAIGCFGIQLGISLNYLVTTLVVENHKNLDDIGKDLSEYVLGLSIASTVVIIALILFFKNEPPLPPSDTRALQKANLEIKNETYWLPVKRIISNRSFLLLWNAYGIHLSCLGTLATLMNQLYLAHFKDGELDVGRMGLGAVLVGAVGAAIAASILDRTKKFRIMIISLCVAALISEIMFAVGMMVETKWLVFVSGTAYGTFLTAYSTIAFELCAEITYPESEGTSVGILNMSQQIYGALLILISGKLIEIYGDKAGHVCMVIALVIGTILNSINKGELRRQKAVRASDYNAVSSRLLEPVDNLKLKNEWSAK